MNKNYNKTTLAKELGITRPTLNARLKTIGFDMEINKKTYQNALEMLTKKHIVKTSNEILNNYESLNYVDNNSEINKLYNNLVKQYNYNQQMLSAYEEEMADKDNKKELTFFIEEHRKHQNLQLKVVKQIDLISDKINLDGQIIKEDLGTYL